MAKELLFQNESRIRLKNGIDKIANAVKTTLGPKGRTVVFGARYMGAMTTKDGVTVARHIELADEAENLGAMMIREATSKTADKAGDGTTTATVLAQALIDGGMQAIAHGVSPIDLKRGMDKAMAIVLKDISARSIKIERNTDKINQVARISANNDTEIGDIISKAMEIAGEDGNISVEDSKSMETHVDKVQGMKIDKGFISPYFLTNPEKQTAELDNPYILLCMDRIQSMSTLMPILEKVLKVNRPILIIAKDVEGEALSTLIINKAKGAIQVAAIKTPGFGDITKEQMEDIAVLVGGKIVASSEGHMLEQVTLDDLGTAERVVISKEDTTLINGRGNPVAVANRLNMLRENIATCENDYERNNMKTRLAKLSGGVAVLYIGAATELEMKEKKDRVDDALCATKAALEEGIIPGGGIAYLRSSNDLSNQIKNKTIEFKNVGEEFGATTLASALTVPIKQIMLNAGISPDVIINEISKNASPNFGYDAYSDCYCDMLESGIIDPAKVVRVALENAVSVAGMFITTECVIFDEKVEVPNLKKGR